jgi:hypothetical protein
MDDQRWYAGRIGRLNRETPPLCPAASDEEAPKPAGAGRGSKGREESSDEDGENPATFAMELENGDVLSDICADYEDPNLQLLGPRKALLRKAPTLTAPPAQSVRLVFLRWAQHS